MSEKLGLKHKKSKFGKWYLDLVKKGEIVDQRYSIKGMEVYKPWGMFLIREITEALEEELEEEDHQPVQFPVLIPEENLKKEKEHIKGFEEEVFWITHSGKNKLDEKMCLRPTSETAIYPLYSLWVRSHKDLPLKRYQSCQVYRYETKMTKPLLRGREFFWTEAHTVQRDKKSALKQVKEDMEISKEVFEEKLGLAFYLFQRPEWDKFPGAESSYAYDVLMPDNKSLQISSTHNLGQKFAKVFDIKYATKKGGKKLAYQTCFGPGVSRILGAVIAVHGDDKGLLLPPEVAPVQVVIVPILKKEQKKKVMEKCGEVLGRLEDEFRVKLDDRNRRPGFKFNDWELKGVPLRIEIGPKEVKKEQLVLVRRDTGEKIVVEEEDDLEKRIKDVLNVIYLDLKKRAESELVNGTNEAKIFKDVKKLLKKGFVKAPFCSIDKKGEKCAEKVEKELNAEIRGKLFGNKEKPKKKDKCVVCGKKAKEIVYISRAY